jgi:beta-1,4-mannosyl-glycoprotein beta-1,4-N-acetylglucosaminyltransferase
MKIYDCFLYNGEKEALEIRLAELCDVVDYFIIVQGTHTFKGEEKSIYDLPKDPKIRSIVSKKVNNTWSFFTEVMQRDDISEGLYDAEADDLIIISDADEIPSAEIITQIKLGSVKLPCVLMQDWYVYYLNYKSNELKRGSVVIPYKHFYLPTWHKTNRFVYDQVKGGWHFSFMGGVDRVIEKINSFDIQQRDTRFYKDFKSTDSVTDIVSGLEKVKIDNTYPKYVQDNLEKFKEIIKQ